MQAILDNPDLRSLIEKYGGMVPRYTSYPTAPEWTQKFDQETYEKAIYRSNFLGNNYSLYLHLPFCESQCYFCGCNVVISPNHGIEQEYIKQLKNELSYYGDLIDKNRKVMQMAWGGGTPTYLSPEQIIDLHNHIAMNFNLMPREEKNLAKLAKTAKTIVSSHDADTSPEHEYAIEIDPRFTSKAHLEALYECGFNRLSMGIQDFDPLTQETINRIQSFELVANLVAEARSIGFESINFDLIYGLPHQNLTSFAKTTQEVITLKPDRIALFNYAHIPSVFAHQKKYIPDELLPDAKNKLEIFLKAIENFNQAGFEYIGLDHFAKPEDSMARAFHEKTLSRNFQGYTTHAGLDLFGFGLSAISDVQGTYKQNVKKLNQYYSNELGEDVPSNAEKFFAMSTEDRERRNIIREIMCNGYAIVDAAKYASELEALKIFINDKLVSWHSLDLSESNNLKLNAQQLFRAKAHNSNSSVIIQVTELGRFFVRNIASVFDQYLKTESGHKLFSKAL